MTVHCSKGFEFRGFLVGMVENILPARRALWRKSAHLLRSDLPGHEAALSVHSLTFTSTSQLNAPSFSMKSLATPNPIPLIIPSQPSLIAHSRRFS
jgi:hypothetical protein